MKKDQSNSKHTENDLELKSWIKPELMEMPRHHTASGKSLNNTVESGGGPFPNYGPS